MANKMFCEKIKTFYPTMDEFKNLDNYIVELEKNKAHEAGIAKIIPPQEWTARKSGYENVNLEMNHLIEQSVEETYSCENGFFQNNCHVKKKVITVQEYKNYAESIGIRRNERYSGDDAIEKRFWKTIKTLRRQYAADIPATLFDDECTAWNLSKLTSILNVAEELDNIDTQGLVYPYLYFGCWGTRFPWHCEDMNLYSINYLHFGAPKKWYAIPLNQASDFEQLATRKFFDISNTCPAFLRHKTTLIKPDVLQKEGITCNTIKQEPGEFIVTFPRGYHSGYNEGYNCAEAVNYAPESWVKFGKIATKCQCRKKKGIVQFEVDDLYEKYLSKL